MTRSNNLPTTILPPALLDKLHEWIECIAVINFDLEHGPGEVEEGRGKRVERRGWAGCFCLQVASDAHTQLLVVAPNAVPSILPELDNCYPPVHFSSQERAAIAFVSAPSKDERWGSTGAASEKAEHASVFRGVMRTRAIPSFPK